MIMQDYINQIQTLSSPSFQQIRRIADKSLSHLSKVERDKLWEQLNHGVDLLDSHELMCQYLWSYGNMHEAKILDAVDYLPKDIFEEDFEIVDWGCGQGIATNCFFDYLKSQRTANRVQKITLIEPSKKALQRANLHINIYINNTVNINLVNKYLDDVNNDDIQSNETRPVIHFFSNILDIEEIDLKKIAIKLNESVLNDNYLVTVGPLNETNHRIDAFYKYFNVPLLYDKEDRQFPIGHNKTKTYKAKVYKLTFNKEGNLIPIEFYPSVQFHAAYQLDCVNEKYKKLNKKENKELIEIHHRMMNFETSTPFDIGARVYDDIHPILAVLNNIITRGLPTKASPHIENIFKDVFGFSKYEETYGGMSFPQEKSINYKEIISWTGDIINEQDKIKYNNSNIEQLQLIYSPIAIARVQKSILEALMTEKLDINKKSWKILVEEKDVPCSAIAITDLSQMFNNLAQLSVEYQDLKFPEIDLEIISNEAFFKSSLHLNNNVSNKAKSTHLKKEYDLVIDIAILQTANIVKETFSKYLCKNDCYFNIRSAKEVYGGRNIYTTDRIVYRDLIKTNEQGHYIEIAETKQLLEYFLKLIFRKENFREGQLPILNRALQIKSVIGLLPTGGGKSLTYQLAAMLQPGVTLIVDPLRSLMKDQYDGLINVGIDSCAYINSSLTREEKDEAERKMEQSKLLFVFLSPERLSIYKFRDRLKNMHELNVYFSYGVIDEVHCVSEWGHDFRFSYLHLGRNLKNYVRSKEGYISLFGLTATASFDVLADVERELSGNGAFPLDSETIVRYENSNRLELQYKIEKVNVEFEEDKNFDKNKKIHPSLPRAVKISNKWGFFDAKKDFLRDYIKVLPSHLKHIQSDDSIRYIKESFEERQGSNVSINNELDVEVVDDYYVKNDEYKQAGIVFCPHKKSTGVAVETNKLSLIKSIPDVGSFSGGDESNNNSMQNLELFRDNKQPLMIATKAFGMGIDKPNVRFTVNMNYSSSLESFVQEAGRAGRDRKMALSVILLSDYKLARISRKYPGHFYPLGLLKGRWFTPDGLKKIIQYYKLNIDKRYIDYLTPENDLVRLFCKEGTIPKYFGFNSCDDSACKVFNKCQLRKVPNNAENWIYKDDLNDVLKKNNIKIDKKYIEYQNADYETVMYFYNNSFKGEVIEKLSMFQLLSVKDTKIFYGDDVEIKKNEISTVKGFLTTLLDSEEGQEVVSLINYKTQNSTNGVFIDETDIAKAIYRMTCIELIEDFTQDYTNSRYRIVAKRKKEGEYFKGLNRFLLRYYSADRAKEEIKKVYTVEVKSNSRLEKEIFQCLSYLTTFVYDKISVKRKRAIDDMRTFCITGADNSKDWKKTNEDLKDFIYYYFNSKYAKEDYIADNDEPYSLTGDTKNGKISADWILFKYLKIINENIEGGTPIDNVKHLQGAVRILRRSLTDDNPTLSLLNSFCIFYLGTNKNENLKREVVNSYIEGLLGFAQRLENLFDFWELFDNYNEIIALLDNDKELSVLKQQVTLMVHIKEINNITDKYLKQ